MTEEAHDSFNNAQTEWFALSRWSILHYSAAFIIQVFGNMYTVVPMVLGALQGGVYFVFLGGAALIVVVLVSSAIKHRYFRYRLDDDKIHVNTGFINKKQLSLEYQRIQNISIEHPFYFRPLNLVMLKVDGAGSSGEEVSLAALTQQAGDEMRAFILARKAGTDSESHSISAQTEPVSASQLLISRSPTDLILHGITNNRAWVVAGIAGGAAAQASDQFSNTFASLGVEIGTTVQDYAMSLSALGAVIAGTALIAFVLLVMATLSVIASLFAYYNYRLNTTGTGYLETRGLATHREINMQKSRVQALAIEQNWLDLIIERMHVILEQISHTTPDQPLASGNTRIMVPSITFSESMHVLQDYDIELPHLRNLDFAPISFRFWTKTALLSSPLFLIPPIVIGSAEPELAWVALVFLLLFGIHLGTAYLRYRRWGVAVYGDYIVIRKGVVGIDYVVLPAFKLQRVAYHETPMTRRRNLASVSFLVASRSIKVPFIDNQLARDLVNYCAYRVESSRQSWM